MKHYGVKKVASGALVVALTAALSQPLVAEELNTEVASAGAMLAIQEYIDNAGSAEDLVALLPKETAVKKKEKKKTETKAANNTEENNDDSEKNEIFDDIAIAKVAGGDEDYVNVRKKPTTKSKIVGKIYNNCGARILDETDDGWYKIVSGHCTGYIKAEYFVTGDEAQDIALDNGYVFANIEDTGIHVREKNNTDSGVVTNVYHNENYVVKKFDKNGDWAKVKIGAGVSGWVSAQYVSVTVDMDTAVTIKEEKERIRREKEEAARLAEEQRQRELEEQNANNQEVQENNDSDSNDSGYSNNNNNTYSNNNNTNNNTNTNTNTNSAPKAPVQKKPVVSDGGSGSGTGAAVVAYAKQFLGNPYVYGGSSLTHGTDCSGFTMSVYAHFGYSLNRTSYTQVNNGRAVSLSSLQPGDLVFYRYGGGTISHVALYIGGGQIIHASTEETGIIISGVGSPCAARRIIG